MKTIQQIYLDVLKKEGVITNSAYLYSTTIDESSNTLLNKNVEEKLQILLNILERLQITDILEGYKESQLDILMYSSIINLIILSIYYEDKYKTNPMVYTDFINLVKEYMHNVFNSNESLSFERDLFCNIDYISLICQSVFTDNFYFTEKEVICHYWNSQLSQKYANRFILDFMILLCKGFYPEVLYNILIRFIKINDKKWIESGSNIFGSIISKSVLNNYNVIYCLPFQSKIEKWRPASIKDYFLAYTKLLSENYPERDIVAYLDTVSVPVENTYENIVRGYDSSGYSTSDDFIDPWAF